MFWIFDPNKSAMSKRPSIEMEGAEVVHIKAPIAYKELVFTCKPEMGTADLITFLTDLSKKSGCGSYFNRFSYRMDKNEFDLVFRCYDGKDPASMFDSIEKVLEVLLDGEDLHHMSRTLHFADGDCVRRWPESMLKGRIMTRLHEKFEAAEIGFLNPDDGAYDYESSRKRIRGRYFGYDSSSRSDSAIKSASPAQSSVAATSSLVVDVAQRRLL
jgi:hypothetical protein